MDADRISLTGRARDWWLGTLPLLVVLVLIDRFVGWRELLQPWYTFPLPLLGALLALFALSHLARALRVYVYFQPLLRGRFPTTLRLSLLHTMSNVLLPMRLGELLFPWLMGRYFGHGMLAAGASLLWLRLLDIHFIVLTGCGVLWLRQPAWWWPLLALAWLATLPALAWIGERAARGAPDDEHPRGWRRVMAAVRFVARAAPGRSDLVVQMYLWTALCWLAKFIAFAAVLRHFVPVEFWRALVGAMGAELSSILPFHGIAGAGSYELATVVALTPLGVNATAALAGAVNLHLFMLGGSLLFGALALLLPVSASPAATAQSTER